MRVSFGGVPGRPKKVRLVSNNLSYGPRPECGEEIEQRLTINAEGRVWLSGYSYRIGGGLIRVRSLQFAIDRHTARDLISEIALHLQGKPIDVFVTDVGEWKLEIVDDEGTIYRSGGPLCPVSDPFFSHMSEKLRAKIRNDLFAFDGEQCGDNSDFHFAPISKGPRPIPGAISESDK